MLNMETHFIFHVGSFYISFYTYSLSFPFGYCGFTRSMWWHYYMKAILATTSVLLSLFSVRRAFQSCLETDYFLCAESDGKRQEIYLRRRLVQENWSRWLYRNRSFSSRYWDNHCLYHYFIVRHVICYPLLVSNMRNSFIFNFLFVGYV